MDMPDDMGGFIEDTEDGSSPLQESVVSVAFASLKCIEAQYITSEEWHVYLSGWHSSRGAFDATDMEPDGIVHFLKSLADKTMIQVCAIDDGINFSDEYAFFTKESMRLTHLICLWHSRSISESTNCLYDFYLAMKFFCGKPPKLSCGICACESMVLLYFSTLSRNYSRVGLGVQVNGSQIVEVSLLSISCVHHYRILFADTMTLSYLRSIQGRH